MCRRYAEDVEEIHFENRGLDNALRLAILGAILGGVLSVAYLWSFFGVGTEETPGYPGGAQISGGSLGQPVGLEEIVVLLIE